MSAGAQGAPLAPGMVDVHSHVLPGIDDGAPDVETSLAMLREAWRGGTTDLVATPHQHPGRYPNEPEAILAAHALLDAAVGKARERGEELPRLHLGAEVHLEADVVERVVSGRRLRIAGGPYLLLELPDVFPAGAVEDVVYRLRLAGVLPVLAHPERIGQLIRQPDQLRRLVGLGALAQVTAASITGLFGEPCRRTTEDILRQRLAHFVASDAHDVKRRTTSLALARKVVDGTLGEESGRRLFEENPRALLCGRELVVPPPEPLARKSLKKRLSAWLRRP